MDQRLIPINAFVALCAPPGSSWPNPLWEVGYRLEALEMPANPKERRIVIDCVAFHPPSNRFLLAEGKSGGIEAEQAVRYGTVDPKELVRTIGVTITAPGELDGDVIYVCLAEHVDRVVLGLTEAGCSYSVLAVGNEALVLHGRAAPKDPALAAALLDPIEVKGPPPFIIKVDEQSPAAEYDALVGAALVAEVAHGNDTIGLRELAAAAVPHLHLLGKGSRNQIEKHVTAAARRACEQVKETFSFRPSTENREYAMVRVLDSPEGADPRGRTQRYQAIAARLGGAAAPQPDELQGELFDEVGLTEELEKTDTGDLDEPGEEDGRP